MPHNDSSASESPEFGSSFKPNVLSYSDLDDDCHYITLREADPVKFKKRSKRKNCKESVSVKKSAVRSLKELEREKERIEKEIKDVIEKTKSIEIINLISDDENTTDEPQPHTSRTESTKIQLSKPKVQRETSPKSLVGKKFSKNLAAPKCYERENDTSSDSYEHCRCCIKRKRLKISKEEDDICSSDSSASKLKVKGRARNIANINNSNSKRLKINNETSSKEMCDEYKKFHDVEESFGDYRCRICNIEVHSEVTLQTHLVGKKHLRSLKALSIPDVALKSLEQFSSKPSSCISVEYDENQRLHYPPPAPGKTRILAKKVAKLQSFAESYRRQPITGLSYITEILLEKDTIYYCELCDSKCVPDSIMCHLIGFKHKLNFFKIKYPKMYERFQYKHKRDIEPEMMTLLFDHDKRHGRGFIKVEEEVDNLRLRKRLRRRSYSPHRRDRCFTSSEVQVVDNNDKRRNVEDSHITNDLDVSMNDYYCKVCESHMNNEQMWEAHIRGRRHLKNKKKRPGENPSKLRNIHCPGEKPILMNDLLDVNEPIVGLNYVHEIQGRAGNQYKCFLCQACCTSFDIIDHIVSEKHRIKLLEVELKKGRKNDIEAILNLGSAISISSREKLIAEEAARFQREYGKGKISVYKSKDVFSDLY